MKTNRVPWNPQFVPSNPSPLSSPNASKATTNDAARIRPGSPQASTTSSTSNPQRDIANTSQETIQPITRDTPDSPKRSGTSLDTEDVSPSASALSEPSPTEHYNYDQLEHDDSEHPNTYKYVPPEFLNRLATFPLFNKAPKSFHTKVASKLTLMQYHPQEYIIKKGDPSKSMYWILKGTVSVTSTDGESVYAELVSGSFFGEIGILFNRPRTATVVARTKVLVGVLTSDALNTVLKHYPLIERRIRDEAQERLAMQEKKKKYDLPNLIAKPRTSISHSIDSDAVPSLISPSTSSSSMVTSANNGINASVLATQASRLPGPSLPPITHSPSPLSAAPITPARPSTSDNVDASISIQDFIKNLPVFQNLPSSIIHQVALEVEPFNVNAFEYIFHKGEINSDIYFIINGEVEVIDVVTNPTTGKITENVLARLQSGSYFGEMSFLSFLDESKNFTRSKSIRSISTVELMVIKSDNLKSLCTKYPFFVDEMKKTAQERNRSNNEMEPKEKLSINYLINDQQPVLQHPQSKKFEQSSFFSPNWEFNLNQHSANGLLSRSISPITNADPNLVDSKIPSSENSSIKSPFDGNSFSTKNTSLDGQYMSKKRKASISRIIPDESQSLSMPSLNPVVPSLNSFQNFQFNYNPSNPANNRTLFQYLPHNKRMRLASVSGPSGRRRSSILSNNGPLPDRILLKVFEFLPLPVLMRLRVLSKRWRQLLYIGPQLFTTLDLTPWNTSIDDKALIKICDFVGTRPQVIDISNCFHITDEGFSYMVNEIGILGNIKVLRMKSNWEVSAMSIMDLTVPSVGQHLEEIDLSNCRKVRDNVLERLIGWDEEAPVETDFDSEQIGCKNLKILNVGYCKHLTDNFMLHIANHANKRLESLDLTRCTTITDQGFQFWTYRSFPNLKKLSLKDCTFLTDKSIISIANAATNLEILDLNFCCALSNIAIEVLCLGCPNIRELDLSFCGSAVSDSSLVAISLNLRNLEKLILTGCIRVTRAGVDALLSGCSPLNYINISQCKNAHIYPGRIPAQKLNVNSQTKSAFVTAGPYQNIIEIVI